MPKSITTSHIHDLQTTSHRSRKTPNLESSAALIAGHDDLLMQILVYLPIISLFRFQSVSKHWFSIIADPFFRRRHWISSSSAGPVTHLLFRHNWLWHPSSETPPLNFFGIVTDKEGFVAPMEQTVSDLTNSYQGGLIYGIQSCNGLTAIAWVGWNGDQHVEFSVYNPVTRQRKDIPRFEDPYDLEPQKYHPHFCGLFVSLNIAFDPLESDNYKLVYVWSDSFPGSVRLAIFRSETQIWSCVNWNRDGAQWSAGVYWNGNLHWHSDFHLTLCLDLENECEKDVPESPLRRAKEVFFFGLCGGDLCSMGLKDPELPLFDVFKLESDYSRWTLKYCLDLSVLPRLYPFLEAKFESDEHYEWGRWRFTVLSCTVEKEEDQPVLMISLPGKVVSCHTDGMIVKEMSDIVPPGFGQIITLDYSSRLRWYETFKYVETFASV